jgi:hypothetical protein
VSNILIGLALRGAATAIELTCPQAVAAKIRTTDRRDIMVDLSFFMAQI